MKFVQKKFDNELANDLGLDAGRQRISVQFKIDRSGNVVNVRARAPHPRLEQEAIKVVQQLPKMTPGKQRGKAVGVLYALPIVFQVEN
jgi:protein TonB